MTTEGKVSLCFSHSGVHVYVCYVQHNKLPTFTSKKIDVFIGNWVRKPLRYNRQKSYQPKGPAVVHMLRV